MAKTITQSRKTGKHSSRSSSSKITPRTSPRASRVTTPVYDRHIEVSQDVRGGKPRVAGRRIAVEDIVTMHLYHGQSIQHIIDSYNLAPVQVYAALTYYYDHRAEIDQSLADGVTRYESEKAARPSLLTQKHSQAPAAPKAP
ncbi:MAG: DUF433 domain-containing protein [Chloroflexi bacterium]|nr:DUF433 domain-containing protein [Chloroflexota bacterium]